MKRGTQEGYIAVLSGNRLWAPPPERSPRNIRCIPSQTYRTCTRPHRPSSLRRHHPSALGAAEDGLQWSSCMLSAPRAPQTRSACPFARRHDRSSHLHVFVEPHAPHSHDHMIVRMCHTGLAFSLLHLPTAQESSAASHKCHFCVCHLGRVFNLPYKYPSKWFNAIRQDLLISR